MGIERLLGSNSGSGDARAGRRSRRRRPQHRPRARTSRADALRPHFKAHKCPELMRRQLAGGDCTGVTCATAWEAEVVARAGLHDDILVANEVADPGGLASLRRAAERARITVAIDSPRHLELLAGLELRRPDRDQRRPGPLRARPGRRGRAIARRSAERAPA